MIAELANCRHPQAPTEEVIRLWDEVDRLRADTHPYHKAGKKLAGMLGFSDTPATALQQKPEAKVTGVDETGGRGAMGGLTCLAA